MLYSLEEKFEVLETFGNGVFAQINENEQYMCLAIIQRRKEKEHMARVFAVQKKTYILSNN